MDGRVRLSGCRGSEVSAYGTVEEDLLATLTNSRCRFVSKEVKSVLDKKPIV